MNKLNVYEYTPIRDYTWGSLLIAAKDQDEANKVLEQNYYGTPLEFFMVIPNLFFNGEPAIILNNVGEE